MEDGWGNWKGCLTGWVLIGRNWTPPAGATTLIISLGIITRPQHLAIMLLAVVLLTIQAIVLNRLAGIDYPLWAKRAQPDKP